MTAIINGKVVCGTPEEIKKLIDLCAKDRVKNYSMVKDDRITKDLIRSQEDANRQRRRRQLVFREIKSWKDIEYLSRGY